MTHFNIRNFNPSIRPDYLSIRGLMGRAIRFTAARFMGKRYPFDPKKQIYDPGSGEANTNLALYRPAADENMQARQFFQANPHLSGSQRCVVGVYQKDDDGNLTAPVRWVSVGKIKGFIWSYLKPLIGKSLDNVIQVERVGNNELELTHAHRYGIVPLEGLHIPCVDKVESVQIVNEGNTLRVHYQEQNVRQPDGSYRPLGTVDYNISRFGLGKKLQLTSRIGIGKATIYENPGDKEDPYALKLFTKRFRIIERVAGPPELRTDDLPEDQIVEHEGVIGKGKYVSLLYLNVTLTNKSRINVRDLNMSRDFKATVIRVRSSLPVKHKNSTNGRNEGYKEWIPFNKKIQHFPAEVDGVPDRTTYLHFERGDVRSPWGGSSIVWGKTDMCVASQHFAVNDPESQSHLWPWHDQGGGFFGEIKRDKASGHDLLSHPFGQVDGKKDPWFMPEGAQSLQASKYIDYAAIFTGSNGIDRAPWVNRLFLKEELEFDAPFWSQLMHITTITEDAQGAHERDLVFDEATYYDREPKSLASAIDTVNMGDRQRRRWGAMVGYFLSFALKYIRDEWIRCRAFTALSKIPLLGIPFERMRIPHKYTKAQTHEWINTATWFLDSIVKYVLAATPALYVLLGYTPIPATLAFIAVWLAKTSTGWPGYGYQTAKWGVSPRRTLFPFPRDIFYWIFYLPNIFRGMLHISDEAIAAFAPTFQTRGVTITSSAKKQIFWLFTALPTATASYGLWALYSSAFLFKAGALTALASAFAPLSIVIGASIIFNKLINRVWPGERTKFIQSFIKWTLPVGAIGYTLLAYTFPALAAGAFTGSFLLGLLMNTVWPLYMTAGMVWGWRQYLADQKRLNKANADTLRNVIREVLFFDVIQRDLFKNDFIGTIKNIPRGLLNMFLRIPYWFVDVGRDFTLGWRGA